jgi:energy-coupling factor transporter ATP-binding protein EcfA2
MLLFTKSDVNIHCMFNTKKLLELDLTPFYKNHDSGNEFPLAHYISTWSKYPPCIFYINETFNSKILDFLLKKSTLIYSCCNGKLLDVIKNNQNFKGGTFFFSYKDIFIKLCVKDVEDVDISFMDESGSMITIAETELNERLKENKLKRYEMSIVYPSNVQNLHLEDFQSFIEKSECSKIHLFVKNRYDEYVFEPINLDVPTDIDVELNYGKDFVEIEKEIIKRLNENEKGLYMFHGSAGTGKSTFLKYLTTKVKKDFVYIPATMIESFINNPHTLSSLLQKKNSVLILEDAEKTIVKRMGDNYDSSAVTSLLNISDGILGDILKCPIILTYNCSKNDIDEALRRKGRLQVDYEFGPLKIKDAKKLAKKLGFSDSEIEEKINKDMVIADIYNLTKKTEMSEIKKEEKVIGFGKI